MKNDFSLVCSGCGAEYPFGTYSCPHKDGVLLAELDLPKNPSFDDLVDPSKPGIWGFHRVLPKVDEVVSLHEGRTPLIHSRTYGPELDLHLYIKDEGRNPTGSFKDRAGSVLLSTEKQLGHSTNATATSGNAGGALALYSRLAGIRANIFMFHPSEAKFLHNCSYAPEVFLVDCEDESQITRVTAEACKAFGWSWLTTMSEANPFNVEGYKTIAYEIVREIGPPDAVITPMASGTLALGIWKGMKELLEMNLVSRMPRIVAVQAEAVNPIARAYENGSTRVQAVSGKTVAGGLCLDNPGVSGETALRFIRQTNGAVVSVSERQILEATHSLPVKEGVFAETSGASSLAGAVVARESGLLKSGESVVCINTASGFKDLGAFKAQGSGPNIHHVSPDIDAVCEALGTMKE